MAADDGRGATITLSTSNWEATALVTAINPDTQTRAALDTSHLNTSTYRTFMPEDLVDPGGFSCEFFHNGDTQPAITNTTAETVTITYPVQPGSTNAATIAGSGFCIEFTPGSAAVGELMKGSAKFKWTGTLTYVAPS